MKKITLEIDAELHGRRIKYLLRNHMGLSAALVKRLKNTSGGILLDGESVYVDRQVTRGQVLELNIVDTASDNIEPKDIPLDIIYEDEDIIVLNKPRAMPTHPSQNHHDDTLANGVMYYFRECDFTFRVITRLDRDTSGVVLVAKNPLSAQILSDDIKNKKILKEYIAVVNGVPNPSEGTVCAPIKRAEGSAILRCVARDGKEAVSEYTLERTSGDISLVRLRPLTGRTHQLRVHMSHIGTPIYGDDLYGAPQVGEATRLHCASVSFEHPVTKIPLTLTAPVPEDIYGFFLGQKETALP